MSLSSCNFSTISWANIGPSEHPYFPPYTLALLVYSHDRKLVSIFNAYMTGGLTVKQIRGYLFLNAEKGT